MRRDGVVRTWCNRDPWGKSRRELLINGAYEAAGRAERRKSGGGEKSFARFMKIAGKVGYVTILDGTWMSRVLSVFILVCGGMIYDISRNVVIILSD